MDKPRHRSMISATISPMPYVYILRCNDGTYYVGSTWNVEKRLAEHQSGAGARYTRRRLPVELVFSAEFERVDEAHALEKRIQGWSRAKREALIEGRYEDLPGLARKVSFARGRSRE